MARRRTYLRLRVAAFFAALGLGGAAVFAAALWFGWSRAGGPPEGYITAGLIGGFVLLGLTAWVGFLFDENVARPIMGLARELAARAATDVESKIDQAPGRYLGHLAPAADAVHDALTEARRKRDEAVAAHTARIERDKALLATLVRELSQAVIVVSPDERVMLFNDAAERLFGPISLDRSLERYMLKAPMDRQLKASAETGDGNSSSAKFLTTTEADNQLISCTVSTFHSGETLMGYVLVCEAATDRIRQEASSDRRVSALLEQVRRPTMNIGALLDVMDVEDPAESAPNPLQTRIRDELSRLAGAVAEASHDVEDTPHMAWPRERISVPALLTLAGQDTPNDAANPLTAFCDIYFMSSLIGMLTDLIACDPDRGQPQWLAEAADGNRVQLRLSWTGKPIAQSDLDRFLAQPLFEPYARFTSQEVIGAMDADIWLAGSCSLRIELPGTERSSSIGHEHPRKRDFFDFMGSQTHHGRLSDMSFVVFDTETTGLDPQTDDVVQIAGVRLLRSEILVADDFDELVNPGRKIPPASSKIHGITDDMVAKAPSFSEVATDFADYVEDTVLVAHNAAFDRAFLDRLADTGGPAFNTPFLCTARLSQALDPQINDHTLDALADRYGVEIEPDKRHTALGDAYATAGVFQKMLPILDARDITTLDSALKFQGGP